jgi:hypothetical protein
VDDKEKLFVDEMLDASLRHYAKAEPRPGLEGRVLAEVRARQEAARRRTTWAWAVGVACLAALVTLLMIAWPRQQPAPLHMTAEAPAILSAPAVAKIAPPVQPPISHRPRHPATSSRVDTRPPQFPTPRPLSEQEKLLLEYVQLLKDSPAASAVNTDQDQEHDLEIPPITIAAIKIEPLAAPESEDKK